MSLHSYSKCWLHLIWGTLNREKLLQQKDIRKKVSDFIYQYSSSRNIYMKKNYVNSEHVHALVDLPTNYSIENMMQLLKGASSHWINMEKLCPISFSWARGYAALSVSESGLDKLINYIENQEAHHKEKSFLEEYESFIVKYGMEYSRLA